VRNFDQKNVVGSCQECKSAAESDLKRKGAYISMSNDLPRLQAAQFAPLPSTLNAESRYWRKYKTPVLVKEYAAVSHIHFSPIAPHDFCVTASTRLQIYSARTRAVSKTISRFNDTAFSGEFRRDGKLLIAADASGLVQVFESGSRSILRSIRHHRLPVHVTRFSPHDQTTLLTASDDKTVCLWDMPTQSPLRIFKGHGDYVRTAEFLPQSPHLLASGGYDQVVRIWDNRVQEKSGEVMQFTHESNVEQVMPITETGATLASAGGLDVRIWDLVGGRADALRTMQNHARGVTCLAKTLDGGRLLTGGVDGHIKVYDTQAWKVVHSVKYPGSILSAAVSPDDKHLVVGLASGLLSIRTRSQRSAHAKTPVTGKMRSSTVSRILRGPEYKGGAEDRIVEDDAARTKASGKLQAHDRALRQYAYSDALDMVLKPGTDAMMTLSLLRELQKRQGLRQALQNRDEATLAPLLRFLTRHLADVRYAGVCVDVSMTLLAVYGGALGGDARVSMLLGRLDERVREQVARAKEAQQAEGVLRMLFAV
jgi:U3 small nucleolar RNA-associated protein 15